MGLRVQLLGAGHQTCGWRCGYICLWWALRIGNRGGIPPLGSLTQALPTMQKTFPALCQSLLQDGSSVGQPERRKRNFSLDPPIVPIPGPEGIIKRGRTRATNPRGTVCGLQGPRTSTSGLSSPRKHACLTNRRACSPGPAPQEPHLGEPPDEGLAHLYTNQRAHFHSHFHSHSRSLGPAPQEPHPDEPPGEGPAHIYIPPPPPTATPQQLYSLHHLVPPLKRRRANPPELLGAAMLMGLGADYKSIYGPAHEPPCPSGDPATASANGKLDHTGVG